jgi:hypothetical protein
MTHDILPSDIDLANKLRSAGHSDEDIITSLVHRGIDRAEATQLLDDLRNGRPVKTKMQKGLETTPRRRSRERRSEGLREGERENESRPDRERQSHAPSSKEEPHRERRSKPEEKKKGFRFWPWVLVFLIFLSASVGGMVFFNHGQFLRGGFWSNRFGTRASARELPGSGDSGPDTVAARGYNIGPADLALEFRPDGLHVGEAVVTHDNALKVFTDLLGSPTRTIPGKDPETMNYAFDAYGLVICSGKNGANNSILLDCDAVGGATGTKTGFKGLLRAEDGEVIRAETASTKLAAIKKLGLNPAGISSGILDGRYQNLNLVFVYLKSPKRLSAVEIDLK